MRERKVHYVSTFSNVECLLLLTHHILIKTLPEHVKQ